MLFESSAKKLKTLQKSLMRPFSGARELGMTLIEIIIVVALLGTLMTYLVTTLTNTADQAKADQAKLGMGNIATALGMYRIHNNKFPTTAQGLDVLVKNNSGSKKWRGPYIEKKKLNDPWGAKFQYEGDGRKFKITSAGLDEEFDTDDDVTYPDDDEDEE